MSNELYIAVAGIGEFVNQKAGRVTVINQPKHRWWKRSWRLFGRWYITFSNCRVKKRPTSGYSLSRQSKLADNIRDIKGKLYKKNNGCCPHCGKPYEMRWMEMHHVLPWARFPELRAKRANMIMLCHNCHKEVHCNPWKNIEMMKAKAEELGIDLKERYNYE